MSDWDAVQYLKFAGQRTRPALDLAARIPLSDPADVLDVGCGPGNSTQVLADRFPHARILGIDSSPRMIEEAARNHLEMEFRLCDAGRELPSLNRRFDVVFSNACIQWIPNHPALLSSMMDCLKEGGFLAVQVPMNHEEPVHRIIGEVTSREKWKARLSQKRTFHQLRPEGYFQLLAKLSPAFDLWQTTYFHRLPSHEAILEWYWGTGLRPYLALLTEEKRSDFERDILAELIKAYPREENGEILFRFPRFFFLARR